MSLPSAKHDALFRLLISDPRRAEAILRDHLPAGIVNRLDPDHPPEHLEGTAIDGEGQSSQADAIFRVRLAGGGDARVYILLEHKSGIDARTPLQLMRYMLRLWQADLDDSASGDGKLTPILPVVFYHGRGPWTPPLSIQEMIRAPEGLEHPARDFGRYSLVDLGEISPHLMSRNADARAALLAMARAFADTLTEEDEDILVAGIADTEFGRYLLRYVMGQLNLSLDQLTAALARTAPGMQEKQEKEALVGTIAETLLAEGKAVGIAEGKAEGKAETLERQLARRFGPLPRDIAARIAAAEPDRIEAWLDAVLDAPDLATVFAQDRPH